MKIFSNEIEKFYNKFKSGETFAFSKYADGEWMAMNGVVSTPGNGEWSIDDGAHHSIHQLINSFRFKDAGYYVGISCPCCQGKNHYFMKDISGQDEEHLTFANLFVNSNYDYYIKNFIPEFSNRKIVLVANRNSDITKLPFSVEKFYGVGYNAWVNDLNVAAQVIDECGNVDGYVYLFSCGPLGNILAHNCWVKNKNNTYLDVGSTLDLWLNNDVKNKRCYAVGVDG